LPEIDGRQQKRCCLPPFLSNILGKIEMHRTKAIIKILLDIILVSLFLLIVAGCAQFDSSSQAESFADTILTNGRVYTVDDEKPWAESIAIRGDRIVAVGSNAEVSVLRGEGTHQIDLAGRFVMPGFTDSHTHFWLGEMYRTFVQLGDATTLAEVKRRITEYAEAHPDKTWILGWGVAGSYPDLPAGGFHKDMLDELVPDRPVFISSVDHFAWVNSLALEAGNINKDTPDPKKGGAIVRQTGNEPTGVLVEGVWMNFHDVPPGFSDEEERVRFRRGIAELNSLGITRVVSAGWDVPHADQFAHADRFGEIRKEGDLSLRISLTEFVTPDMVVEDFTDEWFDSLESVREKYHDDFISFDAVKFFMDGPLAESYWEHDDFVKVITKLHKRGFQVMTHAWDGNGISQVLDGYEAVLAANGKQMRHRIEHVATPKLEDFSRFKELGVIPVLQPNWILYPGMEAMTPEMLQQILGEGYSQHKAVRSLMDRGATVAFGSDWPADTPDPMPGLRMAVLRQSLDNRPEGGFLPEQRITIAEAIRAYTLNGAYAIHREQDEGSITVGKLADIIVLSDNLLEIDANDIPKVKVETTMVGGKVVYQIPE
jgi:predicted amidohydrolase YtcJ